MRLQPPRGARLKSSNSCGPDGIPAVVLKKSCDALAEPLAQLFNTSLSTGFFPCFWKKSFVFPVHKKGPKRDVRNYRGIAALCAEQHGFMAKRFTSSNLVTYSSFILRTMQERKQIDAIYTDLSAAFDKLNHRIAVAKLERLGFSGSLLEWLRSYLTGREVSVKVDDIMLGNLVPCGNTRLERSWSEAHQYQELLTPLDI
ncbi:uncharacterized protein LOC128092347 [Culex pipiens pallens]|uniref:uncharacterized protein LOC128092347 n=1 Tax=Culex pipiens pallens TaxID=42434 RepID=UPI0022AA266C|nr:uncharacterized protein LOC128092347 [Culex pipiens pallens]